MKDYGGRALRSARKGTTSVVRLQCSKHACGCEVQYVGWLAPQSRFTLKVNRAILYAMDVTKILAELRAEREQIEEAIMSLERLARGRGRRRGRPPAWLTATEPKKRRGRPPGSKNKPKTAAA